MPWESSITVTTPSLNLPPQGPAMATIWSTGAQSPRMLKIPSKMTTTRSMSAGTAARHRASRSGGDSGFLGSAGGGRHELGR